MNTGLILLVVMFIYFSIKRTKELTKRDILLSRKAEAQKKIALYKEELSKLGRDDYRQHHIFWIQQWEIKIAGIDSELKYLPKDKNG